VSEVLLNKKDKLSHLAMIPRDRPMSAMLAGSLKIYLAIVSNYEQMFIKSEMLDGFE